jgi:two-component system sensor histidine kinase RegB
MRQLIQLRWIAVAGRSSRSFWCISGFGVVLPMVVRCWACSPRSPRQLAATLALPRHRVHNAEIMVALLVDMTALTLQLYFSGGATNPFISLYTCSRSCSARSCFSRGSVWVLVAATCFCYALLSVRHVPLVLPASLLAESADLYRIGNWIGFAMVGTLLVPFVTRISHNLSARDAYLAGLRQQAVEEDGIIRMGLFASGAAHELGTPLSSISVILADWRRMPRIAEDPELSAEVAEMQSEVQRCKVIVSDILHSAGEPRGEAMASTPARAFLEVLAEEWQVAHPHVPLVFRAVLPPEATIPPILRCGRRSGTCSTMPARPRRAMWRSIAGIEGEALAIGVSDHGPGFPPDQLASIGRLYQSGKGARPRPGAVPRGQCRAAARRAAGGEQPRYRGAGAAGAAAGRSSEGERMTLEPGRRLVLVEDDETFARTLQRSLERRGYQVALAADIRPSSIR